MLGVQQDSKLGRAGRVVRIEKLQAEQLGAQPDSLGRFSLETGERQRNKTKTIETRTMEHIVISQRCKATGTENRMQEATGMEVRACNRRNNDKVHLSDGVIVLVSFDIMRFSNLTGRIVHPIGSVAVAVRRTLL